MMPFFQKIRRVCEKAKKTPGYINSCAFLLRHGREHLQANAERTRQASRAPRSGAKLVIILFPAHPLRIAGGLFVLLNLAKATRAALAERGYQVLVVYPPRWFGLPTYPYYPNTECIYTFSQAMRLFPSPAALYIHVPDCMAAEVFKDAESPEVRWVKSARDIHINICNQNSELMPRPEQITHLHALSSGISQTAAHWVNNTQEKSEYWHMPTLYIGAYYGSEYTYRKYAEKENIIIYSPDANPYAPKILETLRQRFKGFKLYRLSGVPYVTYLDAISRSKYVISFGEGWDGYFWEPFFCGTFSCCVKNANFFPKGYTEFPQRIFNSYEAMEENLPRMIENFEADHQAYDAYALESYTRLQGQLEAARTLFFKNVGRLYRDEYDFINRHNGENPPHTP